MAVDFDPSRTPWHPHGSPQVSSRRVSGVPTSLPEVTESGLQWRVPWDTHFSNLPQVVLVRCEGGRSWGTLKSKFLDLIYKVVGSLALACLSAFLPACSSDRTFQPPHGTAHLPDALVWNFLPAGMPSAPSLPVAVLLNLRDSG